MPQHLSIRIPWKDNGYAGCICERPSANTACLRLKNIAQSRDDEREDFLCGQSIRGHEAEIPCLTEGGCFLCPHEMVRTVAHPYKKGNPKTHGHFQDTDLIYPPYSLPARPFAWTMLNRSEQKNGENIRQLVERFGIDFDSGREPDLPFVTNWVQDAENQRAIFHVFYEHVRVEESLVVLYAKQVPFTDDPRRVIMGIGLVTSITEPPEYQHTDKNPLRSILWETMLGHSIRDSRENGFLLPYREMMDYARTHPEFDMNSVTVFAEDDYFEEFSYATEHLSCDAVISVLLRTLQVLETVKGCIRGNWNHCIQWTKERLEKVWKDRGPFPGLASMLSAAGFQKTERMVWELKEQLDESGYEQALEKALRNPKKAFTSTVAADVRSTETRTFFSLPPERRKLFWLLSRMTLTPLQAVSIFHPEKRRKVGIDCTDSELLENPYLLYERTRHLVPELQISVKKVDMAVFPPEAIRNISPVPEPSCLESGNDSRRLRAYAVSQLELLARNGHTVYPLDRLILEMNAQPVEPPCQITRDAFFACASFMRGELTPVPCENGEDAWQLKRLYSMDEVIRSSVRKRLKGERHVIRENWNNIVDTAFQNERVTNPALEKRARAEKAAVLKELAESRLSVLTGGAGTGKTTLLALLCKSSQIQSGGVLLLAPTGKACVRMSQAMNRHGVQFQARTVAQFLGQSGRYHPLTGAYTLSDKDASGVPDTVIIDESSMLTEEMFAALLDALRKKAKRVIFVGDPNQLPPIGAGRPFVDLVAYLSRDIQGGHRVGKGFGELTVAMRQISSDGHLREDTELAQWYTRESPNPPDEDIYARLENGDGKEVVFRRWNTPEELEEELLRAVTEDAGMEGPDDIQGFCQSLGGCISGDWMNYGVSRESVEKIESWQILSAYRNAPSVGTVPINYLIHTRYRSAQLLPLPSCKVRSTRYPLGTEQIVYGDKVINTRNQRKKGYGHSMSPESSHITDYVANGEVGIVDDVPVKQYGPSHRIAFSSQPEYRYYWPSRSGDESDPDLELAYALTVHKAQGSEFEKVILILGEPGGIVSRELLYTAITRQKQKLTILSRSPAYCLRDYASASCSETARRLTCLFAPPSPVKVEKQFYEERLIHRTLNGEMVRSKSEVIIANMLKAEGIPYRYEEKLDLGEDGTRFPDFTISDAESGGCFYWEHCGMAGQAEYDKRWAKKKALYAKHGIVEGENLIVSYDSPDGAINSTEIQGLIDRYLK